MKNKGKPVKVLVVDDDRSHRFMLKSMFTEWGWDVEEADDGTTAVAAVEAHSYDAILMDVRMAKMDGMEALRRSFDGWKFDASSQINPEKLTIQLFHHGVKLAEKSFTIYEP